MNARHSTATVVHEYRPTIIETGLLLRRLAIEFAFLKTELKRAWINYRNNLKQFIDQTIRGLFKRSRAMAHALPATSIALVVVVVAI